MLLIVVSLILVQCKKERAPDGGTLTEDDCRNRDISFSADVLPIMQNSCALSGCHGNGSSIAGVSLEGHSGVSSAANAANFLGAIKHEAGFANMPAGASKLSQNDIDLIECWILNGKQNN